MGLYGSPDTGNLYTEIKEARIKPEGYKPQKNIWIWVAVGIVNLVFFLVSNKGLDDILCLIGLDCLIIFGISFVSLLVNLIKRRKIRFDLKFILISVAIFIITAVAMSEI